MTFNKARDFTAKLESKQKKLSKGSEEFSKFVEKLAVSYKFTTGEILSLLNSSIISLLLLNKFSIKDMEEYLLKLLKSYKYFKKKADKDGIVKKES